MDSKIRSGAKVLFVNTVKTDYVANYVFRMWVSSDFTVTSDPKIFKCFVTVDAY